MDTQEALTMIMAVQYYSDTLITAQYSSAMHTATQLYSAISQHFYLN